MQLGLGDGPRVRGARSGSRPGRPRPGGLAGRPAAGAAGGLESGVLGARRDWADRRRGKPILRMKLSPGRVGRWWFADPVPGAGLSDAAMSVLRAAVDETEVLARYQAKTRQMKGSDCLWWTGAVSARGHCRFWLGRAGDRDITVIAYRFAWALEHGAASLLDVPVLGHRCDHPLSQRIWPGHMQASSYLENAREWASRRHTIGAPLRDSRGARGRFQSRRPEGRRRRHEGPDRDDRRPRSGLRRRGRRDGGARVTRRQARAHRRRSAARRPGPGRWPTRWRSTA